MKEEWEKYGDWNLQNITLKEEDFPEPSTIDRIKCKLFGHKWGKEIGGVGTFIYSDRADIRVGNAGSYTRICERCGEVESQGITQL